MRLESEIVKIGQNSSHKAGFFKKRSKAGLCYDEVIVPAYRIRVHPVLIKCTLLEPNNETVKFQTIPFFSNA
jgi:hypothetical protein